MSDEVVVNEFVRVLDEWIAVHDEHLHFDQKFSHLPQIKYSKGEKYIRANKAFTKLPDFVKECMVSHEIGHRELGHGAGAFGLLVRQFAVINGKVEQNELDADLYGAGIIGYEKFIQALKYCKDLFGKAGRQLSEKEFDLRIEALQFRNLQ